MKYTLFLFLACLFLSSCQEEKEGCTDVSAINYDATAEIENGTCKYCDTNESAMFGFVLESKEPSNYLLEVEGLGDVKMEKGCELIIDLSAFNWLPSAEIQWTPAEIFDCPTCLKVRSHPEESVEITLNINSPEGYYFTGSFGVYILE